MTPLSPRPEKKQGDTPIGADLRGQGDREGRPYYTKDRPTKPAYSRGGACPRPVGAPHHPLRSMRANKPVAAILSHHNALVNHFPAQACAVIVERLENGVDLFFIIEATPLKRTCQL